MGIFKKKKEEESLKNQKIEKNEPKKAEKLEKKSKKPLYRVIYDKNERVWLIKKDGAKRTIASFVTKEEALLRVKDLSQTNDLNFVVHKKDGKFQKK